MRKGQKMSQESKLKISTAKIGKPTWSKGKKFSQEHKINLSKSHKGKVPTNLDALIAMSRTPERRKQAGDRFRGKVHLNPMPAETNPNWKGGISSNEEYRSWQKNQWHHRNRSAIGSHTYDEWETLKAQYNWTCPACKKQDPIIKLTLDHIIPLSKGGSNNIENIQPLCKSCNCKKHTKMTRY